ncbi:hypothetical protein BH24CHL7_BH24CHL7_13960 [soil metagenome]
MNQHQHHHEHRRSWQDELEALREEARHFYLHGFDWRGQPPPEAWAGPRWYPPAEEWRVATRLDRTATGAGQQITLPTSTGQLRRMSIAGQLLFDVPGAGEQRLTAYLTHGGDHQPSLFVPFRDATSGAETYGSGRYIDLPYEEGVDAYELDFNLAYSPSCAYSPTYDCPFPPPGNRLEVAVRAGEMNPFDH